MSGREALGTLSRDEARLATRLTAADLLAFLDANQAAIEIMIPGGGGRTVTRRANSWWALSWDGPPEYDTTLTDIHSSTLIEALEKLVQHELNRR